MGVEEHTTSVTLEEEDRQARAADPRRYLVVFEQQTSTRVPLPAAGEVIVGRERGVEVRLRDRSVSRRHARIVVDTDHARVEDLGSHNGVILNGRPVSGSARLASRDLITLGRVTLIYHDAGRPAPGALSLEELAQRAAEELARARTAGGGVTIALLAFEAPPADAQEVTARATQRHPAAWASPSELLLLAPGVRAGDAARAAAALIDALDDQASARAAHASFPEDGDDFAALVARARAALARTEALRITAGTVQRIDLGTRRAVLADPTVIRLYQLLRRLAQAELPVLIAGESGSGKELAARAVHAFSRRAAEPFTALDCGALDDAALSAPLSGTLFLDELTALSPAQQARALRVIDDRRGEVRVIAATSGDLDAEVAAGRLRRDLRLRLATAAVWIPPLRERPRDVAVLGAELLAQACAAAARRPLALAPATRAQLIAYAWPGNVRELADVMTYLAAAVPEQLETAKVEHLPAHLRGDAPA